MVGLERGVRLGETHGRERQRLVVVSRLLTQVTAQCAFRLLSFRYLHLERRFYGNNRPSWHLLVFIFYIYIYMYIYIYLFWPIPVIEVECYKSFFSPAFLPFTFMVPLMS